MVHGDVRFCALTKECSREVVDFSVMRLGMNNPSMERKRIDGNDGKIKMVTMVNPRV